MTRLLLASALALMTLAGCPGHVSYAISDKDRERFAAGMIDVQMPDGKPPLIEGLDNCVVWKAQYTGDEISDWKAALGSDWGGVDWGGTYPKFMTGCVDQSIEYKNNRVQVYLCARALGAGGGCTNNGPYYWSYTGERPWRVSADRKDWYDLPNP